MAINVKFCYDMIPEINNDCVVNIVYDKILHSGNPHSFFGEGRSYKTHLFKKQDNSVLTHQRTWVLYKTHAYIFCNYTTENFESTKPNIMEVLSNSVNLFDSIHLNDDN